MNCFEFGGIEIDEAFRQVCRKMDFAGETQVVDRIIFQIARRYWDCNENVWPIFKTLGNIFALDDRCLVRCFIFTRFAKYGPSYR